MLWRVPDGRPSVLCVEGLRSCAVRQMPVACEAYIQKSAWHRGCRLPGMLGPRLLLARSGFPAGSPKANPRRSVSCTGRRLPGVAADSRTRPEAVVGERPLRSGARLLLRRGLDDCDCLQACGVPFPRHAVLIVSDQRGGSQFDNHPSRGGVLRADQGSAFAAHEDAPSHGVTSQLEKRDPRLFQEREQPACGGSPIDIHLD